MSDSVAATNDDVLFSRIERIIETLFDKRFTEENKNKNQEDDPSKIRKSHRKDSTPSSTADLVSPSSSLTKTAFDRLNSLVSKNKRHNDHWRTKTSDDVFYVLNDTDRLVSALEQANADFVIKLRYSSFFSHSFIHSVDRLFLEMLSTPTLF
jgi:hypothetical protein